MMATTTMTTAMTDDKNTRSQQYCDPTSLVIGWTYLVTDSCYSYDFTISIYFVRPSVRPSNSIIH